MRFKWARRKIKKGMYEYYKISKGFNQYSVCLLEYKKSEGSRLKIARRVTADIRRAKEILTKLIRNKVTVCTFFDVLTDLIIC